MSSAKNYYSPFLYILILCMIVGWLPTSFSQTPEQSYFEWTKMPFSKEELAERRAKLVRLLQKQGKSGVVLIPAADGLSHGETFRQLDDFYYFTGLELPNSILAIDIDAGSSRIYVPDRDFRFENGSRKNDFPGRPLQSDKEIEKRAGINLSALDEFEIQLHNLSKKRGIVYINSGQQGPVPILSLEYVGSHSPTPILVASIKARHPKLNFENIYGSIAAIRMIKSPAEIKLLRKAVDITISGIKKAALSIEADVSERYLEGVMEGEFKKLGSQRLAFGSIIKSGPNSLWPWRILATHYDRRNRNMNDGELVIFDVGCEFNQYVSDVGRTFPVSGSFTPSQKEILTMETNIADQIIAFIKPGISFNDIKKMTDRIIPKEAKKYMQVGLFFGHHLGLSTGDPSISNATLQPGMVFTVEPWYYNHDEGISVFTEDVILVTPKGSEVLSKALPRTPEELELMMGM